MLAAIGIGTNVGDRLENMRAALKEVSKFSTISAVSGVYLTAPWGLEDQADFYNAVVLVDCSLKPHDLLTKLKETEVKLGRVQTVQWGPRVIDLDILYFGDLAIQDQVLSIPHPRMKERLFVIAPLSELDKNHFSQLNSTEFVGQKVERILGPGALWGSR